MVEKFAEPELFIANKFRREWIARLSDETALCYGQKDRVLWHNDKFVELFGYSLPEEISAYNLVPESEKIMVLQRIEAPRDRTYIATLQNRQGRLFDARISAFQAGGYFFASVTKLERKDS